MSSASTREAIAAAAAAVLGEQGYTSARVSDIAARAEVSLGSLYRHFGDRRGLLAAGLAHRLDAALAAWPGAPGESVAAAVWAGVEPQGEGVAKAWAHLACLAPHSDVAARAFSDASERWAGRVEGALRAQGHERRRAAAGARRLLAVGDGLRQRLLAASTERAACLAALELAVRLEEGPVASHASRGAAGGAGQGAVDEERLAGPSPVVGDAARARIARAAAEVLADTGVSAFKVADIAAAAGVSTSLLYYHCPSRAAIAALGLEYVTNLAPSFGFLRRASSANGHEQVRLTLLSEVDDIPVNRALNLIWNECTVLSVEDEELAAVHERFRDGWYRGLLQWVQRGLVDGSMRREPAPALASLLLAYEEGLSLRWLGGVLAVAQARMILEGGLSRVRATGAY